MFDEKFYEQIINNYEYINNVKKIINDRFPIAISISQLCPIYLMGGALRDIRFGNLPKDLDFVCLDNDNIIELFIEKFKLDYKINSFGGYKINYNGMSIDLWKTDDLYSAVEYNIDGLFFDVKQKRFICFGYYDALNNGISVINSKNNTSNKSRKKERRLKLINYFSKIK